MKLIYSFSAICMVLLVLVAIQSCKKEPPTFLGSWETTTTNGFNWEYEISEGKFCQSLPEHFGTTQFCYPYRVESQTDTQATIVVDVQGKNVIYMWTFQGSQTAVIEKFTGDEKEVFVIQRK